MSVVAVWARDGHVTIAADTRATGGPAVAEGRIWRARKVHRVRAGRDEALIGIVGSHGASDLARFHGYPRPPRSDAGLDRWAHDVGASLREAAFRRGVTERADNGEDYMDASWLLALRGVAWHLTETASARVDCTAIGTGGEVALGVLEVLRSRVGRDLTAGEVMTRAVEVACHVNATCGLPIDVEHL